MSATSPTAAGRLEAPVGGINGGAASAPGSSTSGRTIVGPSVHGSSPDGRGTAGAVVDVVGATVDVGSEVEVDSVVDDDGSVVAWGDNTQGQANVPSGLTNAVAISAGLAHSVALLADGQIVVWGNNLHGQRNVPANLTNAVRISAARNGCEVGISRTMEMFPAASRSIGPS